MNSRKAFFLDRDGTVIEAVTNRPELPQKPVTAPFKYSELKFVPDLDEALAVIRASGAKIIIITNQPDVANGYMTLKEWRKIHNAVLKRVRPNDCWMCEHRPEDNCIMRKPNPHMILAAACRNNVDLRRSPMIGDTDNDTIAGRRAGCPTILLRKPYNVDVEADFVAPNLLTAARWAAGWEVED